MPAVGGLAVLLAVVAYPALAGSAWLAAPGIAACLFLAVGLLLRWQDAVTAALVLAGGAYAAFLLLAERSSIDAAAPLVAGGLIVVAELSHWSLERGPAGEPRELIVRRVLRLVFGAFAGVFLSTVVLLASYADVGRGLAVEAAGLAGALAALSLLALIAWRQGRP